MAGYGFTLVRAQKTVFFSLIALAAIALMISNKTFHFRIKLSFSNLLYLNFLQIHTSGIDDLNQIAQKLEQFVNYPNEANYRLIHNESILYYGSQVNLHHTLIKKIAEKLKDRSSKHIFRIATLGGSVSVPHVIKPSQGYHQQFSRWLRSSLGSIGIDVIDRNAAIGGTGSKCIQDLIEMKLYDLVFLEFAMNDAMIYGYDDKIFEHLLEVDLKPLLVKLLKSNPRMQIVIIIFGNPNFQTKDGRCMKYYFLLDRAYRKIAAEVQAVVLKYQHFFCDQKYMNELGYSQQEAMNFSKAFTAFDGFHPSEELHGLVNELIINYMKKSISDALGLDTIRKSLTNEDFTEIEMVRNYPKPNRFYECYVEWKNKSQLNFHISGKKVNSTSGWTSRKENEMTRYVDLLNKTYSAVFNYTNFDDKLSKAICGNNGSQPYLSVFFTFQCVLGFAIKALYNFSDGSHISADYTIMPVIPHGYHYVAYAMPRLSHSAKHSSEVHLVMGTNMLFKKATFCRANRPTITSLIMILLWTGKPKYCQYVGPVIEHRCCSKSVL